MLRRPDGLPDTHWDAIRSCEDRLASASTRDDRSAVVGAAKELCECVASVVCVLRAQPTSTSDDFAGLITAAHQSLDRRPGRGAVVEGSLRNIVQAARGIALEVRQVRNQVGTGHGRAFMPSVSREIASLAEQASILWCSWALARLDEVLRGEVARLLEELRSTIWYRGLLAQRLDEVGLQTLHSEDQERIGVAVARRSSDGGTFVVREAGVTPLRTDGRAWPSPYRSGVAAGLLLSDDGRLTLRSGFIVDLVSIVQLMEREEWSSLAERSTSAMLASDLADDVDRQLEIISLLNGAAGDLDDSRRGPLLALAHSLEARLPGDTDAEGRSSV